MTEREKLAVELRELSARYQNILLVLPENHVGHPAGTFDASTLLRYLSNSALEKASFYQKGAYRD